MKIKLFLFMAILSLLSSCVSRAEFKRLEQHLSEFRAEIIARPKLDLTDTDGDGVLDMSDQEKETPTGARVDMRGVALDSDNDGYPDYKDKEPYSPIGFKVDNNGVAMVPKPAYVTEADVDRIVAIRIAAMNSRNTLPSIKLQIGRAHV